MHDAVTAMSKQSIFLVDDHPMVREWLTAHLQNQPDLVVCSDAADAASALQQISAVKPDVVIVDVSLPGRSGIELIKDIRQSQPNAAVIVLSMHDEMVYAERALRAGARGYIMKRETTEKIGDPAGAGGKGLRQRPRERAVGGKIRRRRAAGGSVAREPAQ